MDEEALEDALENWLPAAYQTSAYEASAHAAALQQQIADLSSQLWIEHHDSWLKEFINFSQNPDFPSAVDYLAETIKENKRGQPDEALVKARRLQHIFAAMHNSAGQRRADFEEIYALQRLAKSRQCLERIARVQKKSSLSGFPWLKGQLLLEKSTCVGRRGDMDQAIQEAQRGAEVARGAGFSGLTLRALGMLTEVKATVADDDASWRIAQGGLKQFWQGGFPAIRGYQFYGSIGYTAENAQQWQLATALNLQAVALASQTDNKSIEAMARYRLAGDALMAGDQSLAAKQLERAEMLFAVLPQTESRKIYQAYSQVVLAGLEAHREKLERSSELLLQSVPSLANIDDFIIQLSYYQTYGELQLKNGQVAAAKDSFVSALQICRSWLTGLHDESDRVAVETFAKNIYRDLIDIISSRDSQSYQGLALWQEFRALSAAQMDWKQTFQAEPVSSNYAQLTNRVREQLQTLHDRTLLTFVQFHDGLGIWVGDDRGIFFQRVELSESELERKIRHFYALCSQKNSDLNEIRGDGRELYNLLVAPVASRLDSRRVLLIDADESLKQLPFQAIVDSAGRYFGQTVRIINSPGLFFEVKIGHQDDSGLFRQNATILAPTAPLNLSRDLLPLKDAIQEAKSVASHFSRHTLLLREEATRNAMRSALAESATLHFAGHAVLNGDGVGLVLAGKGQSGKREAEFVSAEDIKKEVSPGLRLVVLAACSTGTSGEDDLYDRGNLARAFLEARVEHVVTTRWDVDSESTMKFIEQFYSNFAQNGNLADALQAAESGLWSDPATSHPYFWAAFQAEGSS